MLVHGLGLLEKLAEAGDACAQTTRTNLRIMVLPVPFPLVIAFVSGHKSLEDYPQLRCSWGCTIVPIRHGIHYVFSYGKYVKSFFFFFFFSSSTHESSMLWLPPTLLVKLHIREFQMIKEALFESSQGSPLVQSILEACIHIQVQYVEGTHQLCIVYTWEFHVKGWQCWCDNYTGCSPAQMVFSVFHPIPGILHFGLSKFSYVLSLNISKYCPNAQYCLNLYLTQSSFHRTFVTWSGTDRTTI